MEVALDADGVAYGPLSFWSFGARERRIRPSLVVVPRRDCFVAKD